MTEEEKAITPSSKKKKSKKEKKRKHRHSKGENPNNNDVDGGHIKEEDKSPSGEENNSKKSKLTHDSQNPLIPNVVSSVLSPAVPEDVVSSVLSPAVPEDVVSGDAGEKNKKKKKKEKKKKNEKKEKASQVVASNVGSSELVPSKTDNITMKTSTPPVGAGSIFSLVALPSSTSKELQKSPNQIKLLRGSVALLPSSLPDVPNCIRSLLQSLLLVYDRNMGGVLLGLEENVTLLPLDSSDGGYGTATVTDDEDVGWRRSGGLIGGRIVDDLPYIHYRFQVKGLLFCPSVGMKLRGHVIECTPTFITLTTHHILSTKISTENLHQQGFFYNAMTLEWTRERDSSSSAMAASSAARSGNVEDENGESSDVLGPSTSIYLDDTVEFIVERIHECGGLISLDGTHPSVSAMN